MKCVKFWHFFSAEDLSQLLSKGPQYSYKPSNPFNPVLTTKGICYGWNNLGLSEIYRHNEYTKTFDKIFGQNGNVIQDASIRKVTFVFDKNENYLMDRQGYRGSVYLGLNKENEPFEMLSKPTLIQRGFTTIINVKPTSFVTDIALKNKLDPSRRNCRFDDEMPQNMSLFQKYSI